MSTKLEGDNRTLQMVWPVYAKLTKLLSETDEDFMSDIDGTRQITLTMKKTGREYMQKKIEQTLNPNLSIRQ